MSLENVLARFFSNKATKEELERLEIWKGEAQGNIEALDEMNNIWDNADDLKEYQSFDTTKALMKVNSAIVSEELKLPSKSSSPSLIRRILPMAASLLLLCAVVWGVKGFMKGDKIETYTSTDSVTELDLKDQTKVTLDQGSNLTIISDFKDVRQVKAEGRMFFEVSSDVERPFVINTYHGDVSVVGTSFTVYTSKDKTEVHLFEGQVNYSHNGQIIELYPSDAILVENGELTKYRFDKENINSWKTNQLVFDGVHISKVFKSLERHFEIDIDVNSKLIDFNCKLSSTFSQLDIKSILKELELLYQLEYQILKEKIVIKKLSC